MFGFQIFTSEKTCQKMRELTRGLEKCHKYGHLYKCPLVVGCCHSRADVVTVNWEWGGLKHSTAHCMGSTREAAHLCK